MSLSYDEVIREVGIFARPYSQNHLSFSKWRSYNVKATEVPESYSSIHDIEDNTYALIYRSNLAAFEAFQFDSIIRRTQIKRNELLYREMTALWKVINPFHLSGISRNVYVKFFEFVHFSVLNANASEDEVEQVSKVDMPLDYAEGEILNLVLFIDSFFECIDAYAKSMLVGEYCRITKRLASEVKRSNWIKNVDLHNKIFCEGLKPITPGWASFRAKGAESMQGSSRTSPLTPLAAERLLAKSVKRGRDSLDLMLLKYASPAEARGKFRTFEFERSPGTKIRRVRQGHLKTMTDFVSPLSKKMRNFKHRNVIEDVGKDRAEKIPDINVHIIRTPLRFLI